MDKMFFCILGVDLTLDGTNLGRLGKIEQTIILKKKKKMMERAIILLLNWSRVNISFTVAIQQKTKSN